MLMRATFSAFILALGVSAAHAQETSQGDWVHANALTGDPKYPEGFPHFDYVNPDAPKGGVARFGTQGGFDSFNPVLDASGNPAAGMGYLYDTLMAPSLDELNISAQYGLIAEAVSHPADFSSVTFRLRPEARWHDGEPVTAEDVVWSYEETVKNNANQRFYYSHVVSAEVSGRARGHLHLRRAQQPRAAAHHGAVAGAAEALVAGKGCAGAPARYQPHDAGAAARLRTLPDQELRSGPLRRLRAGGGLLGDAT